MTEDEHPGRITRLRERMRDRRQRRAWRRERRRRKGDVNLGHASARAEGENARGGFFTRR